MEETPLVSVLIPTYNSSPEHLKEALECLEAQTFKDWTALIHDDCSSVDVRSIAEPFLSSGKIRFVRSEKRLGIGGNWNACIAQTKSEYVAFLFQDDLWAPEYLSEAIKALQENPSVGFVSMDHLYKVEGMMDSAPLYDAVRAFRAKHISAGLHHGPTLLEWWIKSELTPNIIGEPCFVVLRREALEKTGPFLNDMPQFLDVEYWTRLLLRYDWFLCEGNYGSFRVHPKAASAQNQMTGQGLFDRLRCFELLISVLSGNARKITIQARSTALRKMIGKFFRRVGGGKKVSAQGSGELKKFVLKHPFTVFAAFCSYLLKGGE